MISKRLTLLFIMGGIALLWYLSLPLGCESTRLEPEQTDGIPVPPLSPIEQFRSEWDCDSHPTNWPVGESLALMSEYAYLPPVDAEESFGRLGFERVMPIVSGSMIGYVVSGADVTVIVFRGTDTPSDWIVNLKAFSLNTAHGAIHRGFYNAYQTLKPQVIKSLNESRPQHLWITGHSLGGALALVCAYDLTENERLSIDGIITFGQPLVAKQPLANHLDGILRGRYAIVVNGSDGVPRLPPTYSRCGSLLWFAKDGIRRSEYRHPVVGADGERLKHSSEGDDLTPLSEEEFQQLQAELRKAKAPSQQYPSETPPVEGRLPWLRDHSMQLYLDKMRSLRTGNIGSM